MDLLKYTAPEIILAKMDTGSDTSILNASTGDPIETPMVTGEAQAYDGSGIYPRVN